MVCNLICALILSFFGSYPKEAKEAMDFLNDNREEIISTTPQLSSSERAMALAIVAPEISLFSKLVNFLELRTLYILYLNGGTADFSVGPFQMKPSFVEEMEKHAANSDELKEKYSNLLPNGDQREKRKFRLNKLATIKGELQYLSLFISIAKSLTSDLRFENSEQRLRYWATLYNSGLSLNEEKIARLQSKKMFPRREKRFNYSDIACEFFNEINKYDW